VATQGAAQPPQGSGAACDQNPANAGSGVDESSDRPVSTYTQAASLIGADIMDATRVHLGFAQPASASVISVYHGTPLPSSVMGGSTALVRMASGRLVSPFTPNRFGHQQESSLATMQVEAQQSEKVHAVPQCMSMSMMASGVSGRADSILESFTFVPPSPISNRPLHALPRSPLVQETQFIM
jgi:protein OPY2